MFKLIWDKVSYSSSDKHTVFILCTTVSLAALFAFTVTVYNGETLFQIGHRHAMQHISFNIKSIDNQTKMIVAVRDEFEAARELQEIKNKYWRHEESLYELTDNDGEFKNKFHKKIWVRRDNEIKQEMEKLQDMLKEKTSEFKSKYMFAMRER